MSDMRSRARDNLPSVILTLLSIVQALAFSSLWAHATSRSEYLNLSLVATLWWLQIIFCLIYIILIWQMYVELAMRFRWTPTTEDIIFPFFIGIIELLLIKTIGVELLTPWLFILAFALVTTTFNGHNLHVRARADSENEAFFSRAGKATKRDHVIRLLPPLLSATTGICFAIFGIINLWFALCVVSIILSRQIYGIYFLAKIWKLSMQETPSQD